MHSPMNSPTPAFDLVAPPKLRVSSSQSVDSSASGSDRREFQESLSDNETGGSGSGLSQTTTRETVKVDVTCQRPGDDMSAVDDGPLFRATMKALEQKTGSMRTRMKKVLSKAEAVQL